MSPAVISITTVAYFIILFTISYIAGRKADNEGFFVGNRKSAWYIVAFAMIGSTISGVTFVSVPGMVQASRFSYLQMVLGFIVGQIIIAFVLVPLFYRMNLVSIYEYLENRFGSSSYKTGAWFFFISKMLGAAVRLFLVCLTLQFLIFDPFHLPFLLNVILTVFIVWLYTFRGGVKSLIWTDVLKTFCLVVSVVLCIYYIASSLHLSFSGLVSTISDSDFSKTFFFDTVLCHSAFSDARSTVIYVYSTARHWESGKKRRVVSDDCYRKLFSRHSRNIIHYRTDSLRLFCSRFCLDGTDHFLYRRYFTCTDKRRGGT